ncbi:MAG: hypothetical protein AAF206_11480 [Bacteroidota bacterium]
MKTAITVLLTIFWILPGLAQDQFIKVNTLNKYSYEVTNPTGLTFIVIHKQKADGTPIQFTLAPGQSRKFTEKLQRGSWIKLSYPRRLQQSDQYRIQKRLKELVPNSAAIDQLFSRLGKGLINSPDFEDVIIEKRYYNGKKEYQRKTQERISAKIILAIAGGIWFGKLQQQIREETERLLVDATLSQQLYMASIGRFSAYQNVFAQKSLRKKAGEKSTVFWRIGSGFHIDYMWNVSGSPGQNDYWRNSSGQGWNAHFGLPVEIPTSRLKKHALRLYVSFFEDRVRHRLDSTDIAYLPRAWVKEPPAEQNYFLVNDGNLRPKLNATRYGTGLTLRWGPVLSGYFSATAGFTFHTRTMLHMRLDQFSEAERQYTLNKNKLRDMIQVRETDDVVKPYFSFSYGFIPAVNEVSEMFKRRRVDGIVFILAVNIFPPIGFIEGEDYLLVQSNGKSLEDPEFMVTPIPIDGQFPTESWRTNVRIGMGFSF